MNHVLLNRIDSKNWLWLRLNFRISACKTQHPTPLLGLSFWGTCNPRARCRPMPANGARWGRQSHVPTSALSGLKPPPFAPIRAGKGSPQCVSNGDGHPKF